MPRPRCETSWAPGLGSEAARDMYMRAVAVDAQKCGLNVANIERLGEKGAKDNGIESS